MHDCLYSAIACIHSIFVPNLELVHIFTLQYGGREGGREREGYVQVVIVVFNFNQVAISASTHLHAPF